MVARIALIFGVVALLAGSAHAQSSVMGSVTYPDQAVQSRTAVLEISLEDVTAPDAPTTIASRRMPRPGQAPVMVSVPYDPGAIVPSGRYVLRARIIDGAMTLFTSTRDVRVLTGGHGSLVNLSLTKAEAPPVEAPAPKATAPATPPTPAATPAPIAAPIPAPKVAATPNPTPSPKPAPKTAPAPTPTPVPAPKVTPTPPSTTAPVPAPTVPAPPPAKVSAPPPAKVSAPPPAKASAPPAPKVAAPPAPVSSPTPAPKPSPTPAPKAAPTPAPKVTAPSAAPKSAATVPAPVTPAPTRTAVKAPAKAAPPSAAALSLALPPPEPIAEFPATFAGTLPCADCRGIRYELTLLADSSYSLRKTFDGQTNRVEDETGSWGYSSDRVVLTLRSDGDRWSWFAVRGSDVLRAVDARGESLGLRFPADLRRTDASSATVPRLPSTRAAEGLNTPLHGSDWKLLELENKPVRPASQTLREIVLTFDHEDGGFSGVSGCNEFDGAFEAGWRTLTLTPAKPLRICRIDDGTERALSRTLKATRAYRITGRMLELFDEAGARIARFEAK